MSETYNKSVLKVLNHVFFVIGNGYDWKDGFPCGEINLSGNVVLKRYAKKDLNILFENRGCFVCLEIDRENNQLISFLKDNNFYDEVKEKKHKLSNKRNWYIFDSKLVLKINNKIDEYNKYLKEKFQNDIAEYIRCKIQRLENYDAKFDYISSPYPISKYSKIMEMYNGEQFDLSIIPYVKIYLNYAISYYNDIDTYKLHSYYSNEQGKLLRDKNAIVNKSEHWDLFQKEQIEIISTLNNWINKF